MSLTSLQRADRLAMFDKLKAGFNSTADSVNVGGDALRTLSLSGEEAGFDLAGVKGTYNAIIDLLNASGKSLKASIAEAEAIVPVDPYELPPPPPVLATVHNTRTGTTYEHAINALDAMRDGDTLEFSPGSLLYGQNCGAGQSFGGGTATHLPIRNHGVYKALDAKRPPVIRPAKVWAGWDTGGIDADGITLGAPFELNGKALEAEIDGFRIEDLGIYAAGQVDSAVLLRGKFGSEQKSVSVRNVSAEFCMGGGVKGSADLLVIEDSDFKNNGNGGGNEHNGYVGGRKVKLKRVRSWIANGPGTGVPTIDGHLFKIRSGDVLIEDSDFDNHDGDASACLQMPNGGMLVMRNTRLWQGTRTRNGRAIFWLGDEGMYGHTLGPRNFAGFENFDPTKPEDVARWESSYPAQAALWKLWLESWSGWDHGYDIQNCTIIDDLGNSKFIDTRQSWSGWQIVPTKTIFLNNTCSSGLILPPGVGPVVVEPPPAPPPAFTLPADAPEWAKTLHASPNTLMNITRPGDTAASAWEKAGYNVPGWQDEPGNLSAWAARITAPKLGKFGSLLDGADGHERGPTGAIHRLDLNGDDVFAQWFAPIIGPQIHRQIAPDYLPPPKGAECWYSEDERIPQRGWADVLDQSKWPIAEPFRVGAYAFSGWPTKYGCTYGENDIGKLVGAGMRYDQFAIIPEECGGEKEGTLVILAPGVAHELNHAGSASFHTWEIGMTSRKWQGPSIDQMPNNAAKGISVVTAFSERDRKLYSLSGASEDMGVYDHATRSHSWTFAASGRTAYATEGTAIITHGHASHLMICNAMARGTNRNCLGLVDLSEPPGIRGNSREIYGIMEGSQAEVWGDLIKTPGNRLIAALPGADFKQLNYGSLAWSRRRQQLFVFQPFLDEAMLHVITIPKNWRTEPWKVQRPQIKLGDGVEGLSTGTVLQSYKGLDFNDALDCLTWNGAPSAHPVQAFAVEMA